MDRSVFLSDIDGTLVRGDVRPPRRWSQAADVFRAAGGRSPCVPAEVWREPALWRSH